MSLGAGASECLQTVCVLREFWDSLPTVPLPLFGWNEIRRLIRPTRDGPPRVGSWVFVPNRDADCTQVCMGRLVGKCVRGIPVPTDGKMWVQWFDRPDPYDQEVPEHLVFACVQHAHQYLRDALQEGYDLL